MANSINPVTRDHHLNTVRHREMHDETSVTVVVVTTNYSMIVVMKTTSGGEMR